MEPIINEHLNEIDQEAGNGAICEGCKKRPLDGRLVWNSVEGCVCQECDDLWQPTEQQHAD